MKGLARLKLEARMIWNRKGRVRWMVRCILMCGAVSAVVVISLYRREPCYEGKALSDWIIEMRKGPPHERARAVVHQLGTNSIPLLLEWLKRPDGPSLKGRYWQAKEGVIGYLERHRWMKPRSWTLEMDWKSSYRALAQGAFEEMGPDGKEAIPTLVQWLGRKAPDTNVLDELAGAAYCVLGRMGPASIPPLIEALSSRDDQVYALAAGALGNIGPDAKAAIPALRRRLSEKDPMMRAGAADVIGKLGGDPDEVVRIVVGTLREVELENLSYVLEVLLRYKKHAQSAVPVLQELLKSIPDSTKLSERMARDQVKAALRTLDTAVLEE